jgi:hypothetical protein
MVVPVSEEKNLVYPGIINFFSLRKSVEYGITTIAILDDFTDHCNENCDVVQEAKFLPVPCTMFLLAGEELSLSRAVQN